jgi:ribonuclease J
LQSQLAKAGIEVVTPDEAFVHVSGHPAQEELIRLYQWLRPQSVIPTHGEYPHMVEHARIAKECQVPHVLVPENGMLIHLKPDGPEIVDHTGTETLAIDGSRILPLNAASLRTRQKMSFDGTVICSLVLDRKGRLMTDPALTAPGLLSEEEDKKALRDFASHLRDKLDELPLQTLKQDGELRESVRLAIRRYATSVYAKKPWIEIHILRVQ